MGVKEGCFRDKQAMEVVSGQNLLCYCAYSREERKCALNMTSFLVKQEQYDDDDAEH